MAPEAKQRRTALQEYFQQELPKEYQEEKLKQEEIHFPSKYDSLEDDEKAHKLKEEVENSKLMFKIALMYEGLDHSDLIQEYKDCINLLMCLDDNIKKFMNENFMETAETRKVTKLMMDPSVSKLVFWSNTAQLNAETIQENLKAENKK